MTLASGASASPQFPISGYARLGLVIGAGLSATALTYQVATASGATFLDLYDTTNTQIIQVVTASRAYGVPTAVAVWPWVKMVTPAAEPSAFPFTVVLKS